MRTEIKRAIENEEYLTEEKCHILEVANDSGDELMSIARARVEPGLTTAWHRLRQTHERYLIVSGTGLVEIENLSPTQVNSGDVVRIPAGTAQRITNTGSVDLVFFAVCTPPFAPGCYISLE